MVCRFKELKPTTIARMYHSALALLHDTKVLVAKPDNEQMFLLSVDRCLQLY